MSLLDRTATPTLEPLEDITRRDLIKSTLAGMVIIACGGNVEEAATPVATTRIIDTPMGSVTVPVQPRRIVALDAYSTLQFLDELGAPLVAAGSLGGGVRTLVSKEAEALPSIGIPIELDLEVIAAAQPDLIIGRRGIGRDRYNELSRIAPTVLIQDSEINWREILLATADAANLREKAATSLAGIEERVEALQQAISNAWPDGVTVSLLRVADTSGSVYSLTSFWHSDIGQDILSRLEGVNMTANRLADSEKQWGVELSAERLRDVDADVILYYLGGGGYADIDVAEAERVLTGNPLWPHLTAVQAGRAHQVNAGPWFNGGDIEAANLILDDLFRYLAGREHCPGLVCPIM